MSRRRGPYQFASSISLKLGTCQCINVQSMQIMSLPSSIYDHFFIWPSSVTLTFNLPTYDFFFAKNPNLKDFFRKESKSKRFFFLLGGGGGGGGGRGRWMDRGTIPNQFALAPSTSSMLGHNNAIMYKLCP